jgi:uncharacterized protein DUF998
MEITRPFDGTDTRDETCSPGARVTKSLLGYGVVAGPFYVLVALAQALFRPGFDLLHDDVSLLSNGNLGWIQVANFVLTGAMVMACAVGAGRALGRGRGATSGPILLGLFGLGLIGAGIFTADPMNGFPPGTSAGRASEISTYGLLHIATAGIAFLCLISACFVFARRFASEQRGGRMWFSVLTGVAFLAAFVGVASGSDSAAVVIAFWAAMIVAWIWVGALAVFLYRQVSILSLSE